MLTLPMVHPVPRKLSSHLIGRMPECLVAHGCARKAMSGLTLFSSTSSSSELNHANCKQGIQIIYAPKLVRLWPAATNVVALHPHQTKRKSTAIPSWITQPPRNIFKQRKGRHGVDPAFNFIFSPPRTYSKMLTLPMVHPVPRKLA